MKFKADPEALVMAALADGPQHGYGIIRVMRETSTGLFELNEGQLYPLLHKMQAKGWIAGEWQILEAGNPRKNYTLTESGLLELEKRRRDWETFTHAVSGVISKATVSLVGREAVHG
jgi:DNA-binding PadR family transcriptional regulator